MNKKLFSKILSTACAIATMTLCFSKVQAATVSDTATIDSSKSYIIYSGSTKNALYDDNGVNEGWLRQGNYLDFDKSFSWKIEKNGEGFYLKNEGTNYYVKGNEKFNIYSNVVSDKNGGSAKGLYLFEQVEGGYKLKSTVNNQYLTYGVDKNYITFTNDTSAASVWQIEEVRDDAVNNYIIYSNDKNTTLYDSGGANEGWLQKGIYVNYDDKFAWRIENINNSLYLRNAGTNWYVKGNGRYLADKNSTFVVSDKNGGSEKGSYLLEKVLHGYKIKSTSNGQYLTYGADRNYITYTSNSPQATVWTIEYEPDYPKPQGSITLWDNPYGNDFYRIPAIATTNEGTLLAVNDLRYDNPGDLGNHRIDLLLKTSTDNGVTWSNQVNLTENYSTANYGFGDAAIVADRNSDKVIILAAAGDKGFWHANSAYVSTRKNPIKIVKLVSEDGGKTFSEPQDLTKKIYDLDLSWTRLFAASGRIMQSRYVKVGAYHRIYTSILVGKGSANGGNYVIYSDDFGDTWKLLGNATSPVPNGDEAKIEELPNGNVVITSRTGTGRNINVFTYNDSTFATGQWESSFKKLTLGNGSACNGETYIVYAKDTTTKEYKYLALQSLPTLGNSRKGVGIYYKELTSNDVNVNGFIKGWSQDNFYMIQQRDSGYSTMSIQKDGKIAFLYEDRKENNGYDAQFITLDLKTITKGKYEMAFKGIGSKDSPYVIDTQDKLDAANGIFSNEKVKWDIKVAQ